MPGFRHAFVVRAPLAAVANFHHDPGVLKRLLPPLGAELHRFDPLAEGSVAEFSLWLGPWPIRWRAVHSNFDPLGGFTDTQVSGPFKAWRHAHRFEPVDSASTRVIDQIEYEHRPGLVGLLTRVLFSTPALRLTFWYRSVVTRRTLER
jgi:ligand-binding SRPBCC domain-containing protein